MRTVLELQKLGMSKKDARAIRKIGMRRWRDIKRDYERDYQIKRLFKGET